MAVKQTDGDTHASAVETSLMNLSQYVVTMENASVTQKWWQRQQWQYTEAYEHR